MPSDIEKGSPLFDCVKSKSCGKKYVLERDVTGDGSVDIFDLEWTYLEGDGDFSSEEVCKLRDEADIIVTNPPFSLYRKFWDWLHEKDKQFLIISPKTAVTYKNVYPLIQENKVWSGARPWGGGMKFESKDPINFDYIEKGVRIKGVPAMWLTNMEHSKRHEFVNFSTMKDNLTYGNHADFDSKRGYVKYENYDAIDVPYYDLIPSDYDGVMGVPFTFLDKFCPEQFEIVGFRKGDDGKDLRVDGKSPYFRMLIRKKRQ